jgi:hypothetical protein
MLILLKGLPELWFNENKHIFVPIDHMEKTFRCQFLFDL